MKNLLLVTLFLALVVGMMTGPAFAQSLTTGDISGTVTDPTGAVVAGATVTKKNLDKGSVQTTTTNSNGGFVFSLTEPGSYSVEISAPGFKQFVTKVNVNVGQATTVIAKLTLGGAGTTIEVTSAAPLLDTDAAQMSTSFDKNLVENLPNGGNDLTAVAYTAPGVNMNTGGGYGNFNVSGLPATSNMFTVDGENQMDPFLNLNNSGPTNLMLGKNSIDEATVVTNAYSGQYGQQAGAQVSFVSKGGSNQFHGNANYQWAGRYLNANNWFNGFNYTTSSVPSGCGGAQTNERPCNAFANNNQWSASFGGPIKKDKAFFFLDTEGIRYIVPATQTVYLPTAQFLSDTINIGLPASAAAGNLITPNTLKTYTALQNIVTNAPNYSHGTPIPASQGSCLDAFTGVEADPTGPAGLVDSNGNPIGTGCVQNYNTSPALPASETLGIGRLDWNIGNRDRAFFRFDIDTGVQATYADPVDPTAFSAASYQPEYNNSLNWSHNFGTTATNQFVAAVSYYRAIFTETTNGATSPFPYSLYLEAEVPITGINQDNLVFPQGRNVTQYQFVDDFAKSYGKHNLKFGVNFRRYDISNFDVGEFATPEVVPGLVDFFSGSSTIYDQNNSLGQAVPENTGGFGIYAQDEWAVTSNFKLTAALRLEHNFNPTCDVNCFTSLNNNFSSIATQGVNTPYAAALNFNQKDAFGSVDPINYSPRVSFTWSPTSDRKTVLSGGFGVFYDAFPAFITDGFVNIPYTVPVTLYGPDFGGPFTAWGDNQAGAAQTVRATAAAVRSIPLSQLTLADLGGAAINATGFLGKLRTPQYQEWNFQIQREVDSKSRVTLAYVGNHGLHEAYPNSTVNASAPGIAGYPTTTPDPRFGIVNQWNSGANSNYNGMTASYTRRMTQGFVVNANYTWSHSLDEISNGGLLPSSTTSILGQLNPASLAASNYGNADYDQKHSFNANYVWTEPYHFGNKWMSYTIGGWLMSQNFIARSGLPYTILDAPGGEGIANYGANGGVLPVQVLGPAQQSCQNGNSQCFNSAQLSGASTNSNIANVFPNEGRNQYRGPGFFDSDLSLMKGFQATERIKVNIGMTVYNIFNHPSFQGPNRDWTGSGCSTPGGGASQGTCGQIDGIAAPPTGPYGSFFQGLPAGREGQFVAKITF